MNNQNEKVSKKEGNNRKNTASRFRKIKSPSRIFLGILSNFKQKNVYKLPSFWIANFIFVFFSIKLIQFSYFLEQFSIAVPREEGINNLIYLDNSMIKGMKTEVLFKYLDDLEKQKNERKIKKENEKL